MKKYEFTGETKELISGAVLKRIRAVKDFGYVQRGELGGWIENEENLSQEGSAWVGEEAAVWGNARVEEHAHVRHQAKVYGNARIRGMGRVWNHADVSENAEVDGRAIVCDFAALTGKTRISDDVEVSGTIILEDDECLFGEQIITNKYPLTGNQQKMLQYATQVAQEFFSWLPTRKYLSVLNSSGEKTLLSINEKGDIFDACTMEQIAESIPLSTSDSLCSWKTLRELFSPSQEARKLQEVDGGPFWELFSPSQEAEKLQEADGERKPERKEQHDGRNHRTKSRR